LHERHFIAAWKKCNTKDGKRERDQTHKNKTEQSMIRAAAMNEGGLQETMKAKKDEKVPV